MRFLRPRSPLSTKFSDLCEATGANVQDVARGIGLDGRIGAKFLHPGPGFGGSCFPKDTRALATMARDTGGSASIVEAVIRANEARKHAMVNKIEAALDGDVSGKRIGVLGVTFKPGTDDMREAPSLVIVPELQRKGALIQAYDPAGMETAGPLLDDVSWKSDAYETADGADALVIITEWNAFRGLDLDRLADLMAAPVLVDLRNIYTLDEIERSRFAYHSVGRMMPGSG